MSDNLPTGNYIISSASTNTYVGRRLVEDHSLNPKAVINLPEGVQAPRWYLEPRPNGRYILRINGSPTGALDRLVFAFLLPEPPAEEWVLTLRREPNLYTIERASREEGWVLPDDEPETQIACRPLIILPTEPPTFPPNELWSIVSIDRE